MGGSNDASYININQCYLLYTKPTKNEVVNNSNNI